MKIINANNEGFKENDNKDGMVITMIVVVALTVAADINSNYDNSNVVVADPTFLAKKSRKKNINYSIQYKTLLLKYLLWIGIINS